MGDDLIYDSKDELHKVVLQLVFRPRIQKSLNETLEAWNKHKLRTEHYKTPNAIYALSRQNAILKGYWNSDAGDGINEANSATYGVDAEAPHPPASESLHEQTSFQRDGQDTVDSDFEAKVLRAYESMPDLTGRGMTATGAQMYVFAEAIIEARIRQGQ